MDILAYTGWSFVSADIRQNVILLAMAGFVALNLFLWWWTRRDGKVTDAEMWACSGIATVYAILATIVIGSMSINRSLHEGRNFAKENLLPTQ